MDEPELILVGGPNGAGKSTFAINYSLTRNVQYLGADAIAAEICPENPFAVRIEASRLFLERLEQFVNEEQSFVIVICLLYLNRTCTMIKKSLKLEHFETSEALMMDFRESVANAQRQAREAGVPFTFIVDGTKYRALPDGHVEPDSK